MSEELLVRHCSPTLAGLKTGSLFSCTYGSEKEIVENVRRLNRKLVPRGLRVLPIRVSGKRALIYVYRPGRLEKDFSDGSVQDILKERGYFCKDPLGCVIRLMKKLDGNPEFPHEIGLFLGYPAEDVKGFIENKAACSKCTGYWKVYGDPQTAGELFAKYRKCTDIYCAQWESGVSIERLAVAG